MSLLTDIILYSATSSAVYHLTHQFLQWLSCQLKF